MRLREQWVRSNLLWDLQGRDLDEALGPSLCVGSCSKVISLASSRLAFQVRWGALRAGGLLVWTGICFGCLHGESSDGYLMGRRTVAQRASNCAQKALEERRMASRYWSKVCSR